MTIYFLDGKVDYFETGDYYPELDDAINLDAGDGYTNNQETIKDIEEDSLIVTNDINLLNFASYNDELKTFDLRIYDKETKNFIQVKQLNKDIDLTEAYKKGLLNND